MDELDIDVDLDEPIVTAEFMHLFLRGPVNKDSINPLIDAIIGENINNEIKMINLIIDSDGGDVHKAMALIDVMRASRIPVRTIAMGTCASSALMIFMNGHKGERYISENCSILSHEASFTAAELSLKLNDFASHAAEFSNISNRIFKLYERATGKTTKYIAQHLLNAKDVWLSAEDCIKHKLADRYIHDKPEILYDV